jgi:hypothetical protein
LAVGEFAPAVSIAAQSAKSIGASDEELMATVSMLSKSTKSAETAGTQVGRFSAFLAKKGMGGKGILEAAKEINAKGLSAKALTRFIPEENARKGFQAIIGQMGEIEQTKAAVEQADRQTGTSRDYVSGSLATAESVETLRRAKGARIQKEKTAMQEQYKFGNKQLLREEAVDLIRERSIKSGEGGFVRSLRTAHANTAQWLGFSADSIVNNKANSGLMTDDDKLEIYVQSLDRHTRALIENTGARQNQTDVNRQQDAN